MDECETQSGPGWYKVVHFFTQSLLKSIYFSAPSPIFFSYVMVSLHYVNVYITLWYIINVTNNRNVIM